MSSDKYTDNFLYGPSPQSVNLNTIHIHLYIFIRIFRTLIMLIDLTRFYLIRPQFCTFSEYIAAFVLRCRFVQKLRDVYQYVFK